MVPGNLPVGLMSLNTDEKLDIIFQFTVNMTQNG